MKIIYSMTLGLFIWNLKIVWIKSAKEEVAKVLSRAKRSSESELPKIDITAFGDEYNLHLKKPVQNIFTEDLKITITSVNQEGKTIFSDATPSKTEISFIENKIFIDPSSAATVKVENLNGEYQLRGLINGVNIKHDSTSNQHIVTEIHLNPENIVVDYVDLNRNITKLSIPRSRSGKATVAEVEVFIVFDNANYNTFSGNTKDILDYLGVFFHAINNRYSTFSDLKISFRVSGVTAIASLAAQPFMESSKTPDGSTYDINKVLENFSKWVYTNRNSIPKYDIATLISGKDLQSKDSEGKYSSGISGLAYIKAACWLNANTAQGVRSLATSVGEDIGGYFDGVYTIAHELAHNLGARHDGELGATSCPWSHGYIMSYLGWGTKNKFYFSKCSISSMKDFIMSTEGSCLRALRNLNENLIYQDNPGDRLGMTALCQKYTKQSTASVDTTRSPSEQCKNLVCRYPIPGKPTGWYIVHKINRPPGDNSVCGNGGRCLNGDCITHDA